MISFKGREETRVIVKGVHVLNQEFKHDMKNSANADAVIGSQNTPSREFKCSKQGHMYTEFLYFSRQPGLQHDILSRKNKLNKTKSTLK